MTKEEKKETTKRERETNKKKEFDKTILNIINLNISY